MGEKRKNIGNKKAKYLRRSHTCFAVSFFVGITGLVCTFVAYSLDSANLTWVVLLVASTILSLAAWAVHSVCECVVLDEEAKQPWTFTESDRIEENPV